MTRFSKSLAFSKSGISHAHQYGVGTGILGVFLEDCEDAFLGLYRQRFAPAFLSSTRVLASTTSSVACCQLEILWPIFVRLGVLIEMLLFDLQK